MNVNLGALIHEEIKKNLLQFTILKVYQSY